MDTWIAAASFVLSIIALGVSFHFWRRQFRPIVTAMVKTHSADANSIQYDLVVLNSGSIPAREIKIKASSPEALAAALGSGANDGDKNRWLCCFDEAISIRLLHNGAEVSCSFGQTFGPERGFWKYAAEIPISIHYKGWFGKEYVQPQIVQILDSDSFTGFMWGVKK